MFRLVEFGSVPVVRLGDAERVRRGQPQVRRGDTGATPPPYYYYITVSVSPRAPLELKNANKLPTLYLRPGNPNAVRGGDRRLGRRPEAPLGPRLLPLDRGFAPPESCPLTPRDAPEAPRQADAPWPARGAARTSGAFSPSCPGQPRAAGAPPRPSHPARSAHLDGRRQQPALLELGPPARARAEAGGGSDGEGRRRGMARRCVVQVTPPPHQPGSTRAGRLRRRSGAGLCWARRCLRRGRPPRRRPPSVQARAGTGASAGLDATFLIGIPPQPVRRWLRLAVSSPPWY
jgi:hypothetical protein